MRACPLSTVRIECPRRLLFSLVRAPSIARAIADSIHNKLIRPPARGHPPILACSYSSSCPRCPRAVLPQRVSTTLAAAALPPTCSGASLTVSDAVPGPRVLRTVPHRKPSLPSIHYTSLLVYSPLPSPHSLGHSLPIHTLRTHTHKSSPRLII